MTYRITYTKRFEKNLKKLTATERAQLKKKLPRRESKQDGDAATAKDAKEKGGR